MKRKLIISFLAVAVVASSAIIAFAQAEYHLIATRRTGKSEKEMNQAAEKGFRFVGVSGGDTRFGGSQVTIIMEKLKPAEGEAASAPYSYKLLATRKTSKMQKEMRKAGEKGYDYRGQTIFPTTFGGKEIVVIVEKDANDPYRKVEYKLLATNRTSTMQKELDEASEEGFRFAGITTGSTTFGGSEVVVILTRVIRP